jgi:hypothetical protein
VIDFRYHVVSIVAVFLALALGLFLGSTTLQSTVTHNLKNQADTVTSQNRKYYAEIKQLNGELNAERGLTQTVEPYAVQDRLTGATIALVSAPGVDSKVRKSLSATLQFAGATVTADVQLQAPYLDPAQDAELGALASELANPNRPLPQGNGATQVAAELAQVLLARPGHKAESRTRVDQALSALELGKFIKVTGPPPSRPASLAVFLVAAPNTSITPTLAQAENTELLTLATDLRAASTATVVGGPEPVPGVSGSTLAAARSDSTLTRTVSTVDFDSSDLAAGRIAVVLALADAADGTVGAYGLGSAAQLPTASATP